MPPKPRPIRKSSSTFSKDAGATPAAAPKDASTPSTSMPPPPDPLPPLGILEAEVTALSSCLQSAVVKTGQVYGFYTDVKRLGLQQYATRPPRSLTSSLGKEIVKYDQLCDAVESHLLRAITVLQRDLAREEARLKAEEEAAAAAAAMKAASFSAAIRTTPPGSPQSTAPEVLPEGSRTRPGGVGKTAVRRQSTISLTSLSRPAFTHRLDLSASALRINPEEMMIPSGISSPVTLAPRSAIVPSLPSELMMAALGEVANRPVDIDLTVDTDIDMIGPSSSNGPLRSMGPLDPSLGSTADKPIDLDMEMEMEFFAPGSDPRTNHPHPSMFGSVDPSQHGITDVIKPKQEEQPVDMALLHALQVVQPSGDGDDIFASLGESASESVPGAPPTSMSAQKAPMDGQEQQFEFDMFPLPLFSSEASNGNEVDMTDVTNMTNMDDFFGMGVPPQEGGTQNIAPSNPSS